jgi:hypothetical protein
MIKWIDAQKDGLPNFRIHGFHTGRKVAVRRKDGSEQVTLYHGYGLFGDRGCSMLEHFEDITHWRPHMALRIYRVGIKTSPVEYRLVRASSQAQAIKFVERGMFTCKVPTQDELIELLNAGVKVESVNVQP